MKKGELSTHSCAEQKSIVMYCDASGAGFGGYIASVDASDVEGCWSESGLSSTWRELEAINRVMRSSMESLEGRDIVVNTDNKNVVSILAVGSRKPYLHNFALQVDNACEEHNVQLVPNWIHRESNNQADFLSRCTDSEEWSVTQSG